MEVYPDLQDGMADQVSEGRKQVLGAHLLYQEPLSSRDISCPDPVPTLDEF